MSRLLLKIVLLAVVVAGIVAAVKIYRRSESKPAEKPKTFYDVIESDDRRLRTLPEAAEPTSPPTRPRRITRAQGQAMQQQQQQFKELTPEEQVQAEKLFEMAMFERKRARLPGMNYGGMVRYCREIIQRFPGSSQAQLAKQMLAEVPQHERGRYNITEEELSF
ncbi:MAG TPA: hypothetical protein VMW23_01210 [Sedimentisphaerales bacterium]|nr:hypothetical protein [Sedimentisphaerales bacterium]